jgi:ubiquinone/menaquinone biosynthesis C-methylase UbiE
MTTPTLSRDPELKARHRAIWASGDYAEMVEAWLLPLGHRIVEASGIEPGHKVLDVAAGTGNASVPAAAAGAVVTALDLTPELLVTGRRRAQAAGLELDWIEGDAEDLPFADESFDVVISALGAMFAPDHEAAAGELERTTKRGGTIGLLSWTPEGMIGALFRTLAPFAPPSPPGSQPPPRWGSEAHVAELFGDRVEFHSHRREILEVTAFATPYDFAEHFRTLYGPAIATRNHADGNGRAAEFDEALEAFAQGWNRGGDGRARFELEYLVSVGTRR